MHSTDAFEQHTTDMSAALEQLTASRNAVEAMMTAQLQKFLPVGHKIDLHMSNKLECTVLVKVGAGNAHPKLLAGYELVSAPQVSIKDDPSAATWSARAFALNQDGKRMSGKTHSAGSTDEVRIYADLFPFLDPIADRNNVENGQPHIDFAAAYVKHWMASDGPGDYEPYSPAESKKKPRP